MTDDDDQWRFSVDEFDDAEAPAASPHGEDAAGVDEQESGGNVAGTIGGLDEDLEPGRPTLENAFFVTLGAAITVVVFMVVAGVI